MFLRCYVLMRTRPARAHVVGRWRIGGRRVVHLREAEGSAPCMHAARYSGTRDASGSRYNRRATLVHNSRRQWVGHLTVQRHFGHFGAARSTAAINKVRLCATDGLSRSSAEPQETMEDHCFNLQACLHAQWLESQHISTDSLC